MANERKTAESFVCDVLEKCRKFDFKSVLFFVILDGASTYETIDLMRNLSTQINELNVVFAPENQCVVDAYIRGYREAINSACDWILEIDAGCSHQPSDIPKFFKTMIQGYDCIFGSRCQFLTYQHRERREQQWQIGSPAGWSKQHRSTTHSGNLKSHWPAAK